MKVQNDDITTGDDDVQDLDKTADRGDDEEDTSSDDHKIHTIPEIKEGGEDADQFTDPIASPSVVGEEDVFSGDAPEGEPADIDDELAKVGLGNDADGVMPLSSDDIDE